MKDFGVNISLLYLSKFSNPNKLLTDECDSYDLFKSEFLEEIFESKIKQDKQNPGETVTPIADTINKPTVGKITPTETRQWDTPKTI